MMLVLTSQFPDFSFYVGFVCIFENDKNNINTIELMTNYAIGRWIVEEQQNGQDRAKYGARVIDKLAEALKEEFGRGYGRETLRNARKFYLIFQNRISQTMFTEFAIEKSQTLFGKLDNPPFLLSWSHYLILIGIINTGAG